MKLALFLTVSALSAAAQITGTTAANGAEILSNAPSAISSSKTNQSPSGQQVEEARADRIQHRRVICGKIVKVLPDGVIVDSGYEELTRAPLNESWLLSGTVVTGPAPHLVEGNRQDCMCVGLVFLADLPPKPVAKVYDYVNLRGYPAGQYTYTSVGDVRRTVRKFSTKLKKAVQWKLDQTRKENH